MVLFDVVFHLELWSHVSLQMQPSQTGTREDKLNWLSEQSTNFQ